LTEDIDRYNKLTRIVGQKNLMCVRMLESIK